MPNYLTFTQPELRCAVPIPARGNSRSPPALLLLGSRAFRGTRVAALPLSCTAVTTTVAAGVADRIALSRALRDRSRERTIIASVVPGPRRLFPQLSATWGAINWFRH